MEQLSQRNQLATDLDTYQRFQRERVIFFDWLDTTAERNAERNRGLSDEDVLAIIAQARDQVTSAAVELAL